jgi:cellulose synthase/poly-beta-1,6-N-acetylglucosamine synthase-like glycosyltransferase
MKLVADALLLTLITLAFVPVAVLLVEVLSALLPQRHTPLAPAERPTFAVLIPAHDESAGIVDTLESILPQLAPEDVLMVVADNCSDDTAQVARRHGAHVVVERHDNLQRGKGYALDFGVRHLAQNLLRKLPEVVIVVDGDCLVGSGTLNRIASMSVWTGRPVQAMYLMKAPSSSGAMGALAEFAWLVKNKVRPLGTHNLGLPCQLMGTGVALPWSALGSLELATGHLVEDLTMGIDFALAGKSPLYCPEALVQSRFPASQEGVDAQRKRWEHGHLSVILDRAPRLLLAGLKRRQAGPFVLGLDICVPPLSLLALLVGGLTGLSAINASLTASLLPLCLSGVLLTAFSVAIGMAWWRFGRNVVAPGDLWRVAGYVLRKVPLYFTFLFRRQKHWVRSKRDGR